MKKKGEKVKYIYSEEFKINIEINATEELIEIFNKKIFNTILKIEKDLNRGCND